MTRKMLQKRSVLPSIYLVGETMWCNVDVYSEEL